MEDHGEQETYFASILVRENSIGNIRSIDAVPVKDLVDRQVR